jgi:hypothetical protein
MKIEDQGQQGQQRTGDSRGRDRKKARTMEMTRVKTLIAGLSVAATVGGWGMMAQHDSTSAAQATADPTSAVSLVSQTTTQEVPQATATAQAIDTPQATATTTLATSLQAIATATPQASATVAAQASATATPQATVTPKPTSTPKAAVAVTRSSK